MGMNCAPPFVAVPLDHGLLADDAVTALAMRLFDAECISLGRAARMAGLSGGDMTTLLARHGIAVLRSGAEELQRSMLEFAESRRT
jgi:predicted HTH domain antitoxin